MLTIENLTVSYSKDAVLKNLQLNLEQGMIHGLLGLNGSGKTTLFHTIYGMLSPSEGFVHWCGSKVNRKQISLLNTENYFYSNITGREYLQLFPTVSKSFSIDIWQDLFKLPLDKLIDNYSTGMRKKLAILGILKLDKEIMLLDEPFNGVDLETGRIIKVLLLKLKEKNKTILVTSHIIETLTGLCDKVHVLENKRIKKSYDKSEQDQLDKDIFRDIEERIEGLIDDAI